MKRYGVTPNLLVIPPQEKPLGVSNPRTRVLTRSGSSLRRVPELVPSPSHPQLALYMSLAPDEKITYARLGFEALRTGIVPGLRVCVDVCRTILEPQIQGRRPGRHRQLRGGRAGLHDARLPRLRRRHVGPVRGLGR